MIEHKELSAVASPCTAHDARTWSSFLSICRTETGVCVCACVCAELIVAAFRDYTQLRGPIMEEVVSSVLPNLDCNVRSFPVGEYKIGMASALVLQLLQVRLALVSGLEV